MYIRRLLQCFVIFIYSSLSLAFTTQYYGNAKHDVLPLHCYWDELDIAVPLNETLYPTKVEDHCVSITCREDYVLMIKHCDRISAWETRPGCTELAPNYEFPYPKCCTKIVCLLE